MFSAGCAGPGDAMPGSGWVAGALRPSQSLADGRGSGGFDSHSRVFNNQKSTPCKQDKGSLLEFPSFGSKDFKFWRSLASLRKKGKS